MKHIPQLDGIRCIAIGSVIFGHWIACNLSGYLIHNFPWAHGVMLFFVLSGFLITGILLNLKEKVTASELTWKRALTTFYARRFLRIFPIYYLLIFLLLFLHYPQAGELAPWLLTYTSNLQQAFSGKLSGEFSHFWSLAVEEQFYLIWPFFILAIPQRHLLKSIYAAILLSFLSRLYCCIQYPGNWMMGSYFSLNLVFPLATGALAAFYRQYNEKLFRNVLCNPYLFYITGALYFCSYFPVMHFFPSILHEATDVCFFSLFALLFVSRASSSGFRYAGKFLLENKASLYIGMISYGLYVYHMFIPGFYKNQIAIPLHLHIGSWSLSWILTFMVLVLIATLSYFLIEKPLNSLKRFFKY
jgi:peptidoglycan/LPS O-acetylase OafA/YrhL